MKNLENAVRIMAQHMIANGQVNDAVSELQDAIGKAPAERSAKPAKRAKRAAKAAAAVSAPAA